MNPRRDEDDQKTLLPCSACGMRGSRLISYEDGTYWPEVCPWCDGLGATDSRRLALFSRWGRIVAHNQLKGTCKAPKRKGMP